MKRSLQRFYALRLATSSCSSARSVDLRSYLWYVRTSLIFTGLKSLRVQDIVGPLLEKKEGFLGEQKEREGQVQKTKEGEGAPEGLSSLGK